VSHKPFDAVFFLSVLSTLMDILLAFAFISLAGGIGQKIIPDIHPNRLANCSFQAAFGVGILVLIYLIAGFLGLFTSWFAWILLGVLILLFHRSILEWLKGCSAIHSNIRTLSPFSMCLAMIVLVIISLRLFEALAPPTHFDALVYHLWLPAKFLEAGKFIFTPENPYWGMPLSSEILYTWMMALSRPETAAVLGWLIGVITLLGLVGLGNSISPRAGWVAAAALLAGETTSSSLSCAYVDWGTTFFGCALIIALDAWRTRKSVSAIALAGLMAGFGFGFKLSAGVLIPAGWAMIAVYASRKDLGKSILFFTLAASALVVIWLGKNAIFTQSFLYPFWGDTQWVDVVRNDFYRGTVSPYSALQIIFIPLAATIEGVEGAPGFSASIGPLLMGLTIGIFFLKGWKEGFEKGLIWFVLAGWLTWIVATMINPFLGQSRLYFALFPAWSLLAAAGFEGFSTIRFAQIRFERLAGTIILISLFLSGIINTRDILQKRAVDNVLSLEEEDVYLTRNLGAYYPAMEAIRNLPKDSLVLNLWEPRGFYCHPICVADTWIDRWYLDRQKYKDEERILESWWDEGFTHVLLHKAGMKFIQENDDRYSEEDWEVLESLLTRLNLVESFGDGFELYRLGSES